ncbi:hypothetical protein Sviol_59920 [Streptomyces violascens]|uniref:Nudix hydrolase domain-containing protein n=2 Tax=Streptomyces violascens TaxID=67381 RepID=A0ABQ3QWI9_9ACTN|nr:hypothetical protein Sviol_59920 [Streptomyces violascens]
MAEAATGHSYEDPLASEVYRPRGLTGTRLPVGYQLPRTYLHGYDVEAGKPTEDVCTLFGASGTGASGGIVSTPADFSVFMAGYAGGTLISDATRKQQRAFVDGASEPAGPGANRAGPATVRPMPTPYSGRMPDDQHRVAVAAGVEIPVPADGEVWTVGAVVLHQDDKAFAQKRGPTRRLFPNCWDIVGGHVEPGESLLDTLAREFEEETGWRLRSVRRLLGVTTWTGDDGGGTRHEADYLVEVEGDLDNPALEWSKHTAYDWFGRDTLHRLKENRASGEYLIHDLIAEALRERPDAAQS